MKINDLLPNEAPKGWQKISSPSPFVESHISFVDKEKNYCFLASIEYEEKILPVIHCSLSSRFYETGMPDSEVIEILEIFFGPIKVAKDKDQFMMEESWIESKGPIKINNRVRHFRRRILKRYA